MVLTPLFVLCVCVFLGFCQGIFVWVSGLGVCAVLGDFRGFVLGVCLGYVCWVSHWFGVSVGWVFVILTYVCFVLEALLKQIGPSADFSTLPHFY